MEKIVVKRSLKDFRERENPWKNRSHEERFIATAMISGTTQQLEETEPPFARIYQKFDYAEHRVIIPSNPPP